MEPEAADEVPTVSPTIEKAVFTMAEARAFLGIGRNKLYELIHAGEVKPFPFCGRPHLHRDDLKACADRAFERAHRHRPGVLGDPPARRPPRSRRTSTTRP